MRRCWLRSKPLVAIVCGLLNPIPPVKAGGPQLVIWNTCKHLDNTDFDWKVLSLWDEAVEEVDFDRQRFVQVRIGTREKRISQFAQRMPYRLVKGWYGVVRPDHLALNLAMVRELKRMQPDVVIVHESYSLCFMAARALPRAKIVFYHHICRLHLDLDKKRWNRLLKAANAGVIAINSRAIPYAVDAFGSKPEKEWVIINGVDDQLINSQGQEKTYSNGKERDFTFINVGRIHPIKGLDLLIDAMAQVLRAHPTGTRLLIVGAAGVDEGGEQKYENQLKKRASEISSEAIQFAGFIPNDKLVDYYKIADCGVLPTRLMEGNSLFLMECQAMGVPVIATGIGGVADVVRDGIDGILLPEAATAQELAEAMLEMIEKRNEWESRRNEIMTHARQKFNYERVAIQIKNLVMEVLDNGK